MRRLLLNIRLLAVAVIAVMALVACTSQRERSEMQRLLAEADSMKTENYSGSQLMIADEVDELDDTRRYLTMSILGSVLIIASSCFLWKELYKQKRTREKEYNKHIAPETIEERLRGSSIYQHFLQKTISPSSIEIDKDDWEELCNVINSEIPRFFGILHSSDKPISQEEYYLSILIRLGFRSKDQYAIMGIQSSTSATMRSRLLRKVFRTEGNAKDYDKMIMAIK